MISRLKPPAWPKLIRDQNHVAIPDLFVEFDDFEISHQHAAGAERFAEAVLVIGAVDVDVALVGIDVAAAIDARFEAAQPEDATGDEIVVLVASGSSEKCRPVGTRDLKTMPGGWPAPMRSAISCRPRGVPRESLMFDGGRLRSKRRSS
jgi:hypothetical protein